MEGRGPFQEHGPTQTIQLLEMEVTAAVSILNYTVRHK